MARARKKTKRWGRPGTISSNHTACFLTLVATSSFLHSTTAQRDGRATQRETAGFVPQGSKYLGENEVFHPTWLRRESTISFNDLSDERAQAAEDEQNEDSLRWPRFIGIGDGDFEAEDGWVSVEDSASVVKCGLTQENLRTKTTEQYLVSGFRRKGLKSTADWEIACQRRDQSHFTPTSFALYPMRLTRLDNGSIYGSCFDRGFVSMISLHPVLELYCKAGFPEYKQQHDLKYADYKYGGWITCDTLMVPQEAVKLFSLEEAISRGRYDPATSEEWVGCSCPKNEYVFAYKASRKLVDDEHELLSIEVKCAPGF